jgi:hypothetical protein
MPLDDEFRRHLHDLTIETLLGLREGEAEYERRLVWEARQKNNRAAIPIAYSNAAIHAFRTRAERLLERYIRALHECGVRIDDEVESEVLGLIRSQTSASHALVFPPAIRGEQPAAVQRAHAMELSRLGNLLYRQAANRLREEKFKARQGSNPNHVGEGGPVRDFSQGPSPRPQTAAPRAFISYSWDDESHREWVCQLATRLRSDGVDVSIDKWETVPGDQLAAFMERSIRENQFVVIICTPRYKQRSDAREGGVGYEGDIMTSEAMNSQNNRKFIPVLRKGAWSAAAPSWLLGKYRVNLSGEPYSERDYEDLVRTLLDKRESAPPLGSPMATITRDANRAPELTGVNADMEFEDIRITRVLVEEVTEPRNDGSRGCALYSIPFALSRNPPSVWAELFIKNWNHPSRFTSMHRPGIASVDGSAVTLNGTTIEEVERYHRDTLQLAIAKTNEEYREIRREQQKQIAYEGKRREERKKHIEDASKRIEFD